MTDTGWKSPGTLADDASVGTVAWVNPTNASASDNSYATATSAAPADCHYLKCTNFGFTIPTYCKIVGIEYRREQKANIGDDINNVRGKRLYLIKAGVVGGDNLYYSGVWDLSDEYLVRGGSTNLWGQAWTPADINSSTFGVATGPTIQYDSEPVTASIDHIELKVYYAYMKDPIGKMIPSWR